jgi:hypothetical protein
MIDILGKLEFKPEKIDEHKALFISPFRKEHTPSFKVDIKKNLWVDFGEVGEKGKPLGGDPLAFVRKWLAHTGFEHSASDGLRWMQNMFGFVRIAPVLKIVEDRAIKREALISYLATRGIPLEYATPYLREVDIRNKNTKKLFFALGMQNEDEGYEVRNAFFKGSVGPKMLTMIRGKIPKPDELHIFEGMMDFLSYLVSEGKPILDGHAMILHSTANLEKATGFIANYGYKTVFSYMDNDTAGRKATENLETYFKTQADTVHQRMNDFYSGYKDVNKWHVDKFKPSV